MRVDEFLQDFTLAQLLPGATFSNLSITLGHRLAGVAGALGGLAAVIVPGGVVPVPLAALYIARGLTPDVATLMRGMSAAGVGPVGAAPRLPWRAPPPVAPAPSPSPPRPSPP